MTEMAIIKYLEKMVNLGKIRVSRRLRRESQLLSLIYGKFYHRLS